MAALFAARAALGASADVPLEGAYHQDGDPTHVDLAAPAGPHSELYLTDPAQTAPQDNRTMLRVPVRG